MLIAVTAQQQRTTSSRAVILGLGFGGVMGYFEGLTNNDTVCVFCDLNRFFYFNFTPLLASTLVGTLKLGTTVELVS